MYRNANFIINLSPKKLAIYLLIVPVLLFIVQIIVSIGFKSYFEKSTLFSSVSGALYLAAILLIVFLWIFWLRSVVLQTSESQLGLKLKWFQIAFAIFIFFILFNVFEAIVESLTANLKLSDSYDYLFNAPREFVNSIGILIAYPIICHYAARATFATRNGKPATFIKAIPYTLILVFGTVLAIPFLHQYFNDATQKKSQLIPIYVIAIGLCMLLFIIGFIAAITGKV